MNQVPSSSSDPAIGQDGSAPLARSRSQASSLLTQRLVTMPLRPTSVPSDGETMPSEVEELQIQLQEARDSIVQWTRAEMGWNGQRRLFKIMTQNVSDLIAAVDGEGNRVWNNSAYGHLLGYSAEELAGAHVLKEAHPDDKDRAKTALGQAIQTGEPQQVQFRARRKDGTWIDLQAAMVPVRDSTGRVDTVVFVAHDVTEKKRLTEALTVASTTAATATVIEGMARDLDRIVTGAIGNLTIAKTLNGAQNAVAVRLNEVERSLQKARDLLEQLGSVSGSSDRPRQRVSVEPVVHEAANQAVRGTMVRPEFLFPRSLPEADLDVDAFSHALRSVLTNSIQAMDKGVVRITAESLSAEQISRNHHLALKPGAYIHLSIQDQGHGIPEKNLGRAFEPYFTTRPGAQGLGLPTALSTVQRLGGTITLDSTSGVGTTAHIYVPALAALPTSISSTSNLPKVGAGGKKRILLMDDEQMILDIVSRMLTHLGYEVKTCENGSQAIAAFTKAKNQGEPFDVVLMDLVIPNGVGGQDAVHTICKIDPAARVIASSGHLDHPVMKEHKKFGFVAALEKPYKLERLQQVIQLVIEQGS